MIIPRSVWKYIWRWTRQTRRTKAIAEAADRLRRASERRCTQAQHRASEDMRKARLDGLKRENAGRQVRRSTLLFWT